MCTAQKDIDSINDAKKLHGCTHINGSLNITARHRKVIEALDENLSSIEVISDYLMINSTRLRSTNFLKNLMVIRGERLDGLYSFVVFENENLVKFWDYHDNFNLTILSGTFFMYNNPKLCYSEIKKLAENVTPKIKYTAFNVSPLSNGDRSICTTNFFKMKVTKRYPKNVTIEWEDSDSRPNVKIVFYTIYWLEVEYGDEDVSNVPLFENKCKGDGWQTSLSMKRSMIITNLKPDTSYAYFVANYISSAELNHRNASSQVEYFKTDTDDPTELLNVQAIAISPHDIRLEWESPSEPNGVLSHHVITGYMQDDDHGFMSERDYCTVRTSTST